MARPELPPQVLAKVLAAPDVRPDAIRRGLIRLVVGPGPSDAVVEAIWNEGQEALKGLHCMHGPRAGLWL